MAPIMHMCGAANIAYIGSLPKAMLLKSLASAVPTTYSTLARKAWNHCATSSAILCLFDPKKLVFIFFVLRLNVKEIGDSPVKVVVVNQACER